MKYLLAALLFLTAAAVQASDMGEAMPRVERVALNFKGNLSAFALSQNLFPRGGVFYQTDGSIGSLAPIAPLGTLMAGPTHLQTYMYTAADFLAEHHKAVVISNHEHPTVTTFLVPHSVDPAMHQAGDATIPAVGIRGDQPAVPLAMSLQSFIELQTQLGDNHDPGQAHALMMELMDGSEPQKIALDAAINPIPRAQFAEVLGRAELVRQTGMIDRDPQPTPQFVVTARPDLATLMMHSPEGVVRPGDGDVVVLFGGTGSKSQYSGVQATLTPMAARLYQAGASPIAVQNPLYFRDNRPDSERHGIIAEYGTLAGQTRWMAGIFNEVLGQVLTTPGEGLTRRVLIATRSTSTGVYFQLMRDYLAGAPYAQVVGQLSGAFVTGILGHSPAEIEKWGALDAADAQANHERIDWLVFPKGVPIFKAMNFLVPPSYAYPKLPLPKLIAAVGAHDRFASALEQIKVLQGLTGVFPWLDVTGIVMDTGHNSAAAVDYYNNLGDRVQVPVLGRIKRILDIFLLPFRRAPGLRLFFDPAFWGVPADAKDTQVYRQLEKSYRR